MACRLRSACRILLSSKQFHRCKSVVTYSGPGTGLCTVRYHSSEGSNVSLQSESPLQKFEWIQKRAPAFAISGENVVILPGPVEYFEELKNQARNASKRVVLASLYLGTSPKVQELVDTIYQTCQTSSQGTQDKPPLKVHILLDCTRGSRGKHNSRTMLLPLIKDFPDRASVSLYHTPDLRGRLKELIPERYNEIIGLSHIKAYIFDDTVIMSGANLSESYFTNRQDRYIMVKDCPQLADFFHKLVTTVSTFSFQLQQDDSLVLDPEFNVHPYEGDITEFKTKARTLVEEVIDPEHWNGNTSQHNHQPHTTESKSCELHHTSPEFSHRTLVDNRPKESRTKPVILLRQDANSGSSTSPQSQHATCLHTGAVQQKDISNSSSNSNSQENIDTESVQNSDSTMYDGKERMTSDLPLDTWIFPLVQMGPLGVTVDEEVTSGILNTADSDMECYLASGYFNLTRTYMDIVLRSKAKFNMLMASPQVNGFYGAKGISGFIPDSYTYIAKKFCEQRDSRGQQDRIQMYEYYKDNWTFHAKGLWIYQSGKKLPFLTLMGSPNFGHRSVHRDLEAQLAIITTNGNLQKQLHQEQERLYTQSERVDKTTYQQEHRKVPLWVKIVSITTRNFW
ncbi:CDP-diacylglycerol--glycerol-3-phosphate 3-phosphatidyltransferase, mitochondrial-like [Amphiura filiformis]|uniref:CDP-diacylglycerol--glycerol-3-phosphate 3-phosphatidyltransferase, mitochondrial-like n=1 Tax=Amphiura filiformis TaxID=82378 RepID=UPI003B21BC4B